MKYHVWGKDVEFQKALCDYLSSKKMYFNGEMTFESIIDGVFVYVNGNEDEPVLIVGLPPVSNYEIEETEYTSKYLR